MRDFFSNQAWFVKKLCIFAISFDECEMGFVRPFVSVEPNRTLNLDT